MLAVIGALLQVIGFGILFWRVDLKLKRADEVAGRIRSTHLLEIYEAAKRGREYEPSSTEEEARRLAEGANSTGKMFRLGSAFAGFGALLQLIGALCQQFGNS